MFYHFLILFQDRSILTVKQRDSYRTELNHMPEDLKEEWNKPFTLSETDFIQPSRLLEINPTVKYTRETQSTKDVVSRQNLSKSSQSCHIADQRSGRSESESFSLGISKNSDVEAASRLAKRLYHLEGFRPADISAHLTKPWVMIT